MNIQTNRNHRMSSSLDRERDVAVCESATEILLFDARVFKSRAWLGACRPSFAQFVFQQPCVENEATALVDRHHRPRHACRSKHDLAVFDRVVHLLRRRPGAEHRHHDFDLSVRLEVEDGSIRRCVFTAYAPGAAAGQADGSVHA